MGVGRALRQIALDLGAGSGIEWVATAYFLGSLAYRLPDPWWLLGFCSFVPILPGLR